MVDNHLIAVGIFKDHICLLVRGETLGKIGEISYGNTIDLINNPIAPVVVAKVHVSREYLKRYNQLPTLR